MTKARAVEVEELTKRFGDFTAVNRVSFQIEEGEIFGFLGPNGAGKTTVIRMLCGLLVPTSGKGRVLGYDVASQAESIKLRIGYMAQKFALYDDLTAYENLDFYGNIYGVPRRELAGRIRELLVMADLGGRENERVGTLSGGWKQRLALGCSIVHHPSVLFLDEPTAGVDPASRRQFWEMIYGLAGQGVTVFVTTHYMDEAEHCNRVGMMYDGRLIACDEPDLLKAAMPGTLLEIAAEPVAEALSLLTLQPSVQEVVAHGQLLHATLAGNEAAGAAAALRTALDNADIQITSIQAIEPSLEDVFISMIEHERRAQTRAAIE
jgi:ABC-2 type transport system ATP-binding protein